MPLEATRPIELLVGQWITLTLGLGDGQVIQSDENGPVPSYEFVTFKYIGQRADDYTEDTKELIQTNPGNDPPEYDPDTLLNIYTEKVAVTMGIQVWSPDAFKLHDDLLLSRKLRQTRDVFAPYFSVFLGADPTSNLVHIGDTGKKRRVSRNYLLWLRG
jgi:hypothetical protein